MPSTVTIYIPVEHHAIIQSILNEGRILYMLNINCGEFPGEKSQMEAQADPAAEHVFLHFSAIGNDFGKVRGNKPKPFKRMVPLQFTRLFPPMKTCEAMLIVCFFIMATFSVG